MSYFRYYVRSIDWQNDLDMTEALQDELILIDELLPKNQHASEVHSVVTTDDGLCFLIRQESGDD